MEEKANMNINKILPLSERRIEVLFEIYASKRDYLRSISVKLKINPSLCSRILKSLYAAGVLDKEQQGKEVFYSLTKDSEILLPLLERFHLERRTAKSKKLATLVKLVNERKDLTDDCRYIYIFGSYALGTETSKSDIDMFFVSDNKKLVARAVRELTIVLNKQVNAIVYSEQDFETKLASGDPLISSIVGNVKERLVVK